MLFTMPSWKQVNPPYIFKWTEKTVSVVEGIDNDIYSTIDACPNACEMWKAIDRINSELINYKNLNQFNRDDTDDEPDDQKLEAHYMFMAQIQEVTPHTADNSGPIFDAEPLQEVLNDDNHYNAFAIESKHPEQPESIKDTYLEEQGDTTITIDSLDMSTNGDTIDKDDNDDLANECDLLASLIEKLKCEIEDFKNKNKSLESSNNHFKEANNELSKTNQLMFKDLKKFQDELEKRHDVNYMSKVELECAKAKTELMSYKTKSQKLINYYYYQLNDLNQKISDMKKELVAHQETIAIMS
ncbi:hypothetical protein Tco_0919725 [Tanacetum coccineum]